MTPTEAIEYIFDALQVGLESEEIASDYNPPAQSDIDPAIINRGSVTIEGTTYVVSVYKRDENNLREHSVEADNG